jgi:hypothetical protein
MDMAWKHMEKAVPLMAHRKQREEGTGTRYNLQRPIPRDLLPPARPLLLEFLLPPK